MGLPAAVARVERAERRLLPSLGAAEDVDAGQLARASERYSLARLEDVSGQLELVMVHATGNLEKVMDESRRVATTAILRCADRLGLDPGRCEELVNRSLAAWINAMEQASSKIH